jgi:peptidoglycan-N-acetylglucosamine deacetylase
MPGTGLGCPRCIVTTSWDDGSSFDIRLAELLESYRMPATFYIPKYLPRRGLSDQDIVDLAQKWEIGGHGIHHLDLAEVDYAVALSEIRGSKDYLEGLLGVPISSYAFPFGHSSDSAKEALLACGLSVGRTTAAFSCLPHDWLAMRTTIQAVEHSWSITSAIWSTVIANDMRPELRLEKFLLRGKKLKWIDLALETLRIARLKGGVWHLWGHSWEVEKFELWNDLERVFATVSQCDGLIRVANGEIPQYYNSSLESHANCLVDPSHGMGQPQAAKQR